MNCFTWYKEDNDLILPEYHYKEEFKNYQGPIHNGQFLSKTIKENINTEETCTNYAGSSNFNGISREGKTEIPINSYNDKCRDHMIINGMCYVFSLPETNNKENKWNILLHHSIFPLDYVKCHMESLQKGTETEQCVVHNFTW